MNVKHQSGICLSSPDTQTDSPGGGSTQHSRHTFLPICTRVNRLIYLGLPMQEYWHVILILTNGQYSTVKCWLPCVNFCVSVYSTVLLARSLLPRPRPRAVLLSVEWLLKFVLYLDSPTTQTVLLFLQRIAANLLWHSAASIWYQSWDLRLPNPRPV